jgi:glycosyltransferase involved in cell wall biosynthesis
MIAVVIPCFRSGSAVLKVIASIGPEVGLILVVDDCCPLGTGRLVSEQCRDGRLVVLYSETNRGVGGAVLTGMTAALTRGAEIIVKVDGDGQMDPALIPGLVAPIRAGQADYTKGNRFFFLSNSLQMPRPRLFGNLVLSFLTKLSSGYWNVMDPTNGFIAIHADIARMLPHRRIATRFFFESDMLFHLGLLRAKVIEFPMMARYADEESNLKIGRILWPFVRGHLRNFLLRVRYRYFVRDFSLASLELFFGTLLFVFGALFGASAWIAHAWSGTFASTGTVMIPALTLLMGFQLILAFLNFDINAVPREPVHPFLRKLADKASEDKQALIRTTGLSEVPPTF